MIISSDGIVIKQRKIANNRRMLVIFTREYGKLSVGTGMNERGKSKSALALRPFTHAEYDIFKSRGYYNLNGANVKHSYYSIGEDIDRFMTSSRLIEYVDHIAPEEQPRQALFDLTIEFLDAVTAASTNYNTMLYAFIVKTLRMNGVYPELTKCVDSGKPLEDMRAESGKNLYFSVSAGGLLCEECAEKEKKAGDTLIFKPKFDIVDVFCYFLDNPISLFAKIGFKPELEAELKQILSEYLKFYMDTDLLEKDFI